MRFHSKFWFALAFAASLAGEFPMSALGQFPWSTAKENAPTEHRTGSIVWKTDLPAALKTAKEQRKLVFLHFSGTHCPPCRKLEENVLSRNDVAITLLSRYVPVFIIVEQSPELVERFQVKSWPTDVLVDFEGREIARHISPQNPQEFIKRISSIAARHHAGQSATIANVRAAVAADSAEESTAPVQQTAADDRKPLRESPRAESKIVSNPHTKDARVPPIVVARNTKTTTTVPSEEDGFSPPNKRKMPPIVRKQRTNEPEQVAVHAPRVEVELESKAAEAESDSAPWRKSQKQEPTEAEEVTDGVVPPTLQNDPETPLPTETGTDSTDQKQEATSKKSQEEAEAPGDQASVIEKEASTERKQPDVEERGVTEPPAVLDELPPPQSQSRFSKERTSGADYENEKTAVLESNEPKPESEEEKPKQTAEIGVRDSSVEPENEVEPVREPEQQKSTDQEEQQPRHSRSRFSSAATVTQEPSKEPEAPAADDQKVQDRVPTTDPSLEQEKSGAPTSEVLEKEPEAQDPGEEKAREEKITSPTEDIKQDPAADEESVEPETKPAAPKSKSKSVPAKAQSEEKSTEQTDPENAEQIVDERPRGLAKIARTGKYVLDGQCCVTLMETGKAKKGTPKIGAMHRGRIYLFSSIEARTKFMGNPDDYSPMLSGYDPVLFAESGELVDGTIVAQLSDNRIVTFSSEETFDKFKADYEKHQLNSKYIQTVRAAMKETNGGRHLR